MFRRLCALAAVAVAVPLTLQPAHAAAPSYVALGDSYSSGTGTRDYLDDGSECLRSAQAYPSLLAASKGYELDFRACSGATMSDVTAHQLGALSSSTQFVTLSVGGNDVGFTDVLTECAKPGWMSDCNASIDGAEKVVADTLPGRLDSLYASIKTKAPYAAVVVSGYPHLFMGEDCNALTWFSPQEEARLNQTADQLNGAIASAASKAGFTFANPTSSFSGHAVCDDPAWLNGLSNPITESYHPNLLGHANGYMPLVSRSLTGSTARTTDATRSAAEKQAAQQARKQRRHAAQDRRIEPERFELPDLSSPRAQAAAKRAGVDLSSRASIDRVDRRASKAQAAR